MTHDDPTTCQRCRSASHPWKTTEPSRFSRWSAEPADTYVSPSVSTGTEDGIVFGQGNELWKQPGTPDGALAYTTPKLSRTVELLAGS